MLLKQLTEAVGVSGNEGEVRRIISNELSALNPITDSMGNIIVHKPGPGKRLMLCAHMDEVGFIVSGITEQGALRFKCVGGIDPGILPSTRVLVGENRLCGVIGATAIHLQRKADRKSVNVEDLVIDIGASGKAEAEKHVKLGDYVGFYSDFVEFGDGLIKAKALDDRVGCRMLLELLKQDYPFDLYACFTVQEEVGLRGARTAAYRIKPDAALILEGTTCSDTPGTPEEQMVTHLGAGAAITIMDRSIHADRGLVRALCECGDRNKIPYQFKQTTLGGTDAGAVHVTADGVRTAVLAVPCRYLHSPVSVCNKMDIENSISLAREFLTEGEQPWIC